MELSLLITLMFGLSFVTAQQNIPISTYKENEVFQNYYNPNPSSTRQAYATDTNQKPHFKDCANYKPTVKEEQVKDTFVIKVQAEDNDPKDKGGTVTYKIVARDNERANFKINNETGEITTLIAFDRDEPLRQKELYLTVIGTDNGIPPLADICTLKVIVTDINDNIPTIDQSVYSTQVAEDLKKDSEVLRIFADDIDDGDNARLNYTLDTKQMPSFEKYFRLDSNTGVLYLKEELRSTLDKLFTATVVVSDNGYPSHSQTAEIQIKVVGSGKKPPSIKVEPTSLTLKEDYTDFANPLVKVVVESNSPHEGVLFQLVKGKTAQTNKEDNFRLIPSDENDYTAYIKLINHLDYETVTDYVLTVRVQNKDSMDSTINIPVTVQDVNDETPSFIDVYRGSIVENDKPGAQAIQIRAVDKDGTSPNNMVNYQLLNYQDLFEIDRTSGIIRSKVQFDREATEVYHVRVQAEDGAPSAIVPGGPNKAVQDFQITIEDRNDNSPHFTQSIYEFSNISEKSNKAAIVGDVRAIDQDTSGFISYTIISGNIDNAFYIENTTGRVKVNGKLDYEKQEDYNLTIMAFDGIYSDNATVHITIINENDELPVFEPHPKEKTLLEETTYDDCIINVKAYDPDIKDRNADQHIVYDIQQQMREFLSVDKYGCVRVIKALDRDKPYGSPTRQVFIYAYDNDGLEGGLHAFTEIEIILEDINDNAPFLNVTEVVWYENTAPSLIDKLSADDYDGPNNGPPFTYELVDNSPDFQLIEDQLHAIREFDREQKKYYDIRIKITDSGTPRKSGISILRVIIGDVNDNPAKDGESEIFVYHFSEIVDDIEIGRVYVDDPDDWDLNDKFFVQITSSDHFYLSNINRGMIMMRPTVIGGKYTLNFEVTESSSLFDEHTVKANVTIIVKEIPREAVIKSGSIRVRNITAEEFIEKNDVGISKKDILQQNLAKWFNTSVDNVDIITVMPSNDSSVDIRFSAHGSPYYPPVKLNDKIAENQNLLEKALGIEFVMIDIDECANENVCDKGKSCFNKLEIDNQPAAVFTNKTSFVGVRAVVQPSCQSEWNGGACLRNDDMGEEELCTCLPGYDGPLCESLSVGFNGNGGWAMYPSFFAWTDIEIIIYVMPESDSGLIFYVGPSTINEAHLHKEFMYLELRRGKPILVFNLGSATHEATSEKLLSVGEIHKVRIKKSKDYLEMEIDECKSQCISMVNFKGDSVLNVNSPLQVGGMKYKFSAEETKMIWGHNPPTTNNFFGCIQNFSINGYFYKLGKPAVFYNSFRDCNYGVLAAVSIGIDSNFLVAILVCIALLIILLLAVVVHRRKQDNFNEKENDDTRANIINYEVEGGGECDTNYDLSVFRPAPLDEKLPLGKDQDPNISDFLENKKDNCDKNPENLPFDDVRHYAYEGDGNSTGSLSSLASCTDEGDLKFHYLSNFGPRFKKLADMYGEDASDEDSHDGGEESWC